MAFEYPQWCRYPSWQEQYNCYIEWRNYLTRFPWQWHASLTFGEKPDATPDAPVRIDFFYALRHFERWRFKIIRKEKLQVGASLLSSHKAGRLTFHVLMIGANHHGKSLLDCSTRLWTREWQPYQSEIIEVYDNYGICDYIAEHFLGSKSDYVQIEPYGLNLLERAMRPQQDGSVYWHRL